MVAAAITGSYTPTPIPISDHQISEQEQQHDQTCPPAFKIRVFADEDACQIDVAGVERVVCVRLLVAPTIQCLDVCAQANRPGGDHHTRLLPLGWHQGARHA